MHYARYLLLVVVATSFSSLYGDVAATIRYCDRNAAKAVSNAVANVEFALPGMIDNYLRDKVNPQIVTNTYYKFYTNTIIETSTTYTVYLENVISNYWHTNYIDTVISNYYHESYHTNYTTESVVSNYWHTNHETDVIYNLGNSYTSTTFNVEGAEILYGGVLPGPSAEYIATNTETRTTAGRNTLYGFKISAANAGAVSGASGEYVDYYSYGETSSNPSDEYRMYFIFRRFVSGSNSGKWRLLFRLARSRPPYPGDQVDVNDWYSMSTLNTWYELPPEQNDSTIDYSRQNYYTGYIKKKSQVNFSYTGYIKNYEKYNAADEKVDDMVFKSTTDALSTRVSALENIGGTVHSLMFFSSTPQTSNDYFKTFNGSQDVRLAPKPSSGITMTWMSNYSYPFIGIGIDDSIIAKKSYVDLMDGILWESDSALSNRLSEAEVNISTLSGMYGQVDRLSSEVSALTETVMSNMVDVSILMYTSNKITKLYKNDESSPRVAKYRYNPTVYEYASGTAGSIAYDTYYYDCTFLLCSTNNSITTIGTDEVVVYQGYSFSGNYASAKDAKYMWNQTLKKGAFSGYMRQNGLINMSSSWDSTLTPSKIFFASSDNNPGISVTYTSGYENTEDNDYIDQRFSSVESGYMSGTNNQYIGGDLNVYDLSGIVKDRIVTYSVITNIILNTVSNLWYNTH